ncbi:MAG: DeoR family transcriptional regulator [Lactobacillus sp.]|nr:DeoR family transcriptional regulator [Lactobacillus sp.]
MIDAYIERDIVRQVKVTEYLFELKQIDMQKVADLLSVSRMTIKRDIEKILLLDPRIQLIEEKVGYVTVNFWSGVTRYELIKKLYEQSYFLKVCASYLLGERNYLKISEKEHISVAKVFSVKKKVEEFFKKSGVMTKEGQFLEDEFKHRLIILTIWMRFDFFNSIIDRRILIEAQKIVEQFMKIFSNELNFREKHFLILNIYLSLKRNEKKLEFPERVKYIYREEIYAKLEKLLIPYHLNENEVHYLTIMYNLLNHNLTNYYYLELEYYQIKKTSVQKFPKIIELIQQFELAFHRELTKDILFEKSLWRFLVSISYNRPMLLVEKNYFIEESQQKLCKKVEELMKDWSQRNQYTIFLNEKSVEKFCLQVQDLLVRNDMNKIWHIFIVAESEFSHIVYREWIRRRLNTEQMVIDQALYYSLDQLPIYIDNDSSIIICERSLTSFPFEEYQGVKLFPTSLFSVDKDFQHLFEHLFNS